ncbi:phage protein [Sporocytophaga myxococcoides]|uniref:Phage protein n=1 Tax=Sporocytophaga myxococcoides TaxID=153721 RepID=A0A098LHI1_9BACT|nr:hypothetical protein [Sporocytophaga myxococcoides]GAL86400.1 phage protein [Sporocytophaga myxococcoides]
MTTSRPLEYVCFFPVNIPTGEGEAYWFASVDVYSKVIFSTGAELGLNKQIVLKHLSLLMNEDNFKKHRDKGFTLIIHKDYGYLKEMTDIIAPYKGKLMISDALVTKEMVPVMEHIFKSMRR